MERICLVVADIPCIRSLDDRPGVYVGAAGTNENWTGVVVWRSRDGLNWSTLATLGRVATVGKAATVLADVTDPFIWDEGHTIQVKLIGVGGALASASESDIAAGANLAVLGSEVVQFRTVTDDGDDYYTLSGLARGRFGTDDQTGTHVLAEDFMLLDMTRVRFVECPIEDMNATVHYRAASVGEAFANSTPRSRTVTFRNLKPLSPQHIAGTRDGSNNLTITWVRRTRVAGEWTDGVDVPVAEMAESYELDLYDGPVFLRTLTATTQTATYMAAQQTADGITPGDPVDVIVYQISDVVGRGVGSEVVTL